METAAIEGEVLRRSSVRASIRQRLGLPVEHEGWDERADSLVSVLLDARLQKQQPLIEERLCGWYAALFPAKMVMHIVKKLNPVNDSPD